MLALARTQAQITKPARETVSFLLNTGNGQTSQLTVPAVPLRGEELEARIIEQMADNAENATPDTGTAFYFTTAETAYDGFGTKTVRPDCGKNNNGKVWRMVQIADSAFEWQSGRNGSGLHATVSPADFYKFRHLYVAEQPAPVPVPVPAETEQTFLSISSSIIEKKKTADDAKLAADHAEFSEHDWTVKPSKWSREAVLYYLEHICGRYISTEARDATDFQTVQNLAEAETLFRLRNTETAKVSVARAALLNAVKNAKKLNPRSPAKTVSLSINGSLDVITSDHQARFSQCLSYIEKRGDLRLTFPEQRLNAIASKLKADILELKLTSLPAFDEYTLTVMSADAEFTMPVDIPDDADRFSSDFPAEYAHNVKAGDLLHAFRMTEFATESESTRYALNGLFIVPAVDSLTIAATDSRRLSVETVSADLLGEMPELQKESYYHSRGVCVPAGIVSLLTDELKRQKASDIVSFAVADVVISKHEIKPDDSLTAKQKQNWKPDTIGHVATMDDGSTVRTHESADGTFWQETTRKEFVFEMPDVFSIRGTPIIGRFPRYMDVIPKSFGSDFVLNRVSLLNACETVMLSTDAESRGVNFCFPDNNSEQTLTLKGQSETAKGVFRAAVDHVRSYDSHTITLDPVYLIDYLKRQASCDVRISLNDAESPILITEEVNGLPSGSYVVMPLARDR